jgi:hypothetical protein
MAARDLLDAALDEPMPRPDDAISSDPETVAAAPPDPEALADEPADVDPEAAVTD